MASAVGLWLIAIVVVLVDACVVGCFAGGSTGCAVGWVGGDVGCGLVGLRLVCFGVVLWFGEFCCRLSVGWGCWCLCLRLFMIRLLVFRLVML